MSEKLKKYCYAIGVGVLLFAAHWLMHKLPEEHGAYDVVCALANAFTLPGVLLAAVGGLTWCASKGTFDLFSYGVSMTIGRFLPLGKKNVFHSGEKYYDYVERKRGERGAWLKECLVVGLGFLFVAIVFTVVSHLL